MPDNTKRNLDPGPTGVDERSLTAEASRQLLEEVRHREKRGATRTGRRAAHVDGLFASGTFSPSNDASELSTSNLFSGGEVPLIARYSPTRSKRWDLQGLAIKFHYDRQTIATGPPPTDLVALDIDRFMFVNADDFAAFIDALKTGRFGRALVDFAALSFARRSSWRVLGATIWTGLKSKPIAHLHYFGIHTFFAVGRSEQGEPVRLPIRYELRPKDTGKGSLRPRRERTRYRRLAADIRGGRAPRYDLIFSLPWRPRQLELWKDLPRDRRDRLINPMLRWSHAEERVMGTITIESVLDDRAFHGERTNSLYDGLMFDPTRLAEGLEVSEDELLPCRAGVYEESRMRPRG